MQFMRNCFLAYAMSFILVLTCVVSVFPINAAAQDNPVTSVVDTDSILEGNFLGIGLQWDPSDLFDYTESEWEMITDRLDFASFPFIRTILRADNYCSGWDSNGDPIFAWDSTKMQRVYRILDYCEAHNAKVIIGEWDKPSALGITQTDDPRWANLLANLVKHLKVDKGYSCIEYLNCVNEPNGDWAISEPGDKFAIWKRAITNLDAKLKAMGIRNQIKIIGPDTTDADTWVNSAADQMSGMIDTYDIHRYAQDGTILSGSLESTVSGLKKYIVENDPNGAGKQFYIGEAGMITGRNGDDQQMRVKNFEYGVFMSDYYIQALRGGAAGTIAWDLDDSMHTAPSNYTTLSETGAHKVWGFWNTKGGVTGVTTADGTVVPSEVAAQNMRPWFYPASLLSRNFPAGSQIAYSSPTGVTGLRLVAAKKPDGAGKYNLSFAVVNNQYAGNGNYDENSQARTVRVVVPGASETVTLNRYNYFNTDKPTDGDGFPVVEQTITGNLADGIDVELPSNGVVILSTIGAGAGGTDAVTTLQSSGDVNLALNKKTSVSSSGYPTIYPKANLNDGDSNTKWVANTGSEQSVTVDLATNLDSTSAAAASYMVNRVKLNWGTGYATAYKIQVAGGDEAYRDVFSQFSAGKGGLEDIVFTPQTDVRYIKLLMNAKGNSSNYAIHEIGVYYANGAALTETPAPPSSELIDNIDTAPPTPAMYASAGLIQDTGAADTKFDGDAGRTKRNGGDPGYCIYKVDQLRSFVARLYFDKGETSATYKFEVSPDGSAWNDITSELVSDDRHDSQDTGWYSENLSADTTIFGGGSKYLKITFSGGQGWSPQLSTIAINSVKEINDTLADLSKVGLASSGWVFATAEPEKFNGDATRIERTTDAAEYLIYNLNNTYSVSVDAYKSNSDNTGVVKLYASSTGTGNSFTELTGVTSASAPGGGDNTWTRTTYSKAGLPAGTNYIKIEVSGGSADSPQLASVKLSKQSPALPPVVIEDDCSSTTAHALSVDGEIAVDTGNPANFNGDTGRFKRNWTDTQSVVYDAGTLNTFKVKVYSQNGFDGSGTVPLNGKVEFFGSADNSTWTKIVTKNSVPVATAEDWVSSYFEPAGTIASGTRYLKITLSGGDTSSGDKCWSPQIADVKINVTETLSPIIIEDDCSSTTAHALSVDGEIAVDTGNPANFDGDTGRFKRTWTDTQSVVYDAGTLNAFKVKVYSQNGFDGSGTVPLNGKVEFFGSADNSTWTKITTKNSTPMATAEDWVSSYFEPAGTIAAGTRYLKITLSGGDSSSGDKCWSPQIADVKINVTETPETDKPFIISADATLGRTAGITASVTVSREVLNPDHTGNEVVYFLLSKDAEPVAVVAMEKNIASAETFKAYFNVSDSANAQYKVEVFVVDHFITPNGSLTGLADKLTLN
jgi:hypothetical protein